MLKKNIAGQKIGAQLVYAIDGTPYTGSVQAYVTGDAGTQALGSVSSGSCTHKGNGYHTYAPAQAETNYTLIAFTFIGVGAVPVTVQVFTTADLIADIANAVPDIGDITAVIPIPPTVGDIAAVVPTALQNADALLKRDWTAVTGEASRSVLNALRFLRNKWTIATGTLTVTKENDTTAAWTGTVTTAPNDPVNSIDPA